VYEHRGRVLKVEISWEPRPDVGRVEGGKRGGKKLARSVIYFLVQPCIPVTGLAARIEVKGRLAQPAGGELRILESRFTMR
jgi:hypothetical protein